MGTWFLSAKMMNSEGSTLTPKDYARWIESETNGLRAHKTIGELRLTAQYKPIEYIVVMEEKDEQLPMNKLQKRKQESVQMSMV